MKLFRLNRLFNSKSRRCFDVATDHGFFNELTFLGGIEDLEKTVHTLVSAGPDAIQLTRRPSRSPTADTGETQTGTGSPD